MPKQKRTRSPVVELQHGAVKRARQDTSAEKNTRGQQLLRPTEPVGSPWPVMDLNAFDNEGDRIGYGKLLKEVLKDRGWKVSVPCHHAVDENDPEKETVWMKEFEACLQGKKPEELFEKRSLTEAGHRLVARPRPKHALWMMGYANYRVPGTCGDKVVFREDFAQTVAKFGKDLPGESGNYRIACFPGTVPSLYKTTLSLAFRDKPWYPTAYVLPKEKEACLRELRAGGESKKNIWIGKPRHEQGGTGIRVWKGSDPDLIRTVKESDGKSSSVLQRYLPDPLLIGGFKFHMRIHLLITNMNPLEAFVQDGGQCLFATKPYTLASSTLGANFDPPVHVTNMGLNSEPYNKENFMKKKPMIGKGQQLKSGMRDLEAHLAKTRGKGFDKKKLWGEIAQIAAETAQYISQAPTVRKYGAFVQGRHFEMFGMDLMLDTNLKVYMCETNEGPGLDYPDEEVLGEPNPDYKVEEALCRKTWHDLMALLGLDAKKSPENRKALKSWYKLDT